MTKIETTCGYRVYDHGKLIGYEGGQTEQGVVFKDRTAFFGNADAVCYVPEYGFPEENKGYYGGVDEVVSYTRNQICEAIDDAWGELYLLTDEQIQYLATVIFTIADWACIETICSEDVHIDTEIEREDKIFTKLQQAAVKRGMYPALYAEALEEKKKKS